LARTDAQRAAFLSWKCGKEFYFVILRAALSREFAWEFIEF
jgi:hypothetical protein